MKKEKIILFYPKPNKENSNMHLPLPVLAVASDLLRDNYRVEVIDERVLPDYEDYLRAGLRESVLFAASVMTGYQIAGALKVSRFVKRLNKKTRVVWGGWHVSILPEETLRDPCIDAGVVGPGEGMLQLLQKRISQGLDCSGVIENKIGLNIERAGSISREGMALLKASNYIHSTELGERSIFWVTSKGCPFSCGFCCSLKVYKRRWRGVEAVKVIEDLEWLIKDYNIDGVNFVDTNFFVDKERARKILEGIIEKGMRLRWAASVRVDQINSFSRQFLDLLKKSGCVKLFVGVESGSKDVLELVDKNITINDIFNTAGILDQAGIIAEMYLMAGFPIEPMEDIKESLSLAKEVKKRHPNHQFTSFLYTPYPGTPMYPLAIDKGLKVPSTLEEWVNWNILEVKTPWIKRRGYSDYLHKFIKMYYPLAFPSDSLRRRFSLRWKGRIYYLLHKIAYFRVKNNFFIFSLEWFLVKFMNKVRSKYKILNDFGGFR